MNSKRWVLGSSRWEKESTARRQLANCNFHILATLAEFERGRIQERVKAGLARAKTQGVRLGRPRRRIAPERLAEVHGLPIREAARRLGLARSTVERLLAEKPAESAL
jgi:DNA invertase Pin-like site-specific DNA recombinase